MLDAAVLGVAVFPFLAFDGELVGHHHREVDAVPGGRQHSVSDVYFDCRREHGLPEEELDDRRVIRFGTDRVGAVVDVPVLGG
eukprot:11356058-Heterocapsa_arctica.AAC.1